MQIKTATMALMAMKVGVTNVRVVEESIRLLMEQTAITDRVWLKMYPYEEDTTFADLRQDYAQGKYCRG